MAAASVTARLPDNRNVTSLAPEDSSLSYAIWGNPPSVNTVVTIYTEVNTLVLLSCGSKTDIFQTLLVTLPTPDFSMPYNVICLGRMAMTVSE